MLVSKTLKRTGVVAIPLLMIAVLFIPGGSAQEFEGTLEVRTGTGVSPSTIFPETQTGTLTINFKYTLPPGSQAATPSGPGIPVQATRGSCPSYVQVVGSPNVLLPWPEPDTITSSAVTEGAMEFDVTIGRDAPGLTTIQCSFTLTASPVGGGNIDGDSIPVDFTVRADYYSLLQAKVSKKVQQAGPYKEVPFDIELTNFGNARTQVAFEVLERPSGGKWSVTVPENVILNSPNSGTGSPQDTATVTVVTTYKNGWNNEQGSYTVLLRPTSADQPDKVGNTVQTNMLVRVRGVYVPGFEPIVMLGAVIGVGLMARMRSDDE